VITLPLVLLAIPSLLAGFMGVEPMIFGKFFGESILLAPEGPVATLREEWHGVMAFTQHGVTALPFILAVAGIATAAWMYLFNPAVPARLKERFTALGIYGLLDNKYYFDKFNEVFFAGGAQTLGGGLWRIGDQTVIDGGMVNGSASVVALGSRLLRRLQTGFLYNYAFMMIFGVFALLSISLWLFKP
jgi:NADH-quinone oxidoreductase subunit L